MQQKRYVITGGFVVQQSVIVCTGFVGPGGRRRGKYANEQDDTIVVGKEAVFRHKLDGIRRRRPGMGETCTIEPIRKQRRVTEGKAEHDSFA